MLSTVLLAFICMCIIPLFEMPGTMWGVLFKGVFVLISLLLFKVAYNKMMLPGTVIGALFFALAWWFAPDWPMYIFLLLMIGALGVTIKTAEAFTGKSA